MSISSKNKEDGEVDGSIKRGGGDDETDKNVTKDTIISSSSSSTSASRQTPPAPLTPPIAPTAKSSESEKSFPNLPFQVKSVNSLMPFPIDYEQGSRKLRSYTLNDKDTVRAALAEHIDEFLLYHGVPKHNGYENARFCFAAMMIITGFFSYLYKYPVFADNRPILLGSAIFYAVLLSIQYYFCRFIEGSDTIFYTQSYKIEDLPQSPSSLISSNKAASDSESEGAVQGGDGRKTNKFSGDLPLIHISEAQFCTSDYAELLSEEEDDDEDANLAKDLDLKKGENIIDDDKSNKDKSNNGQKQGQDFDKLLKNGDKDEGGEELDEKRDDRSVKTVDEVEKKSNLSLGIQYYQKKYPNIFSFISSLPRETSVDGVDGKNGEKSNNIKGKKTDVKNVKKSSEKDLLSQNDDIDLEGNKIDGEEIDGKDVKNSDEINNNDNIKDKIFINRSKPVVYTPHQSSYYNILHKLLSTSSNDEKTVRIQLKAFPDKPVLEFKAELLNNSNNDNCKTINGNKGGIGNFFSYVKNVLSPPKIVCSGSKLYTYTLFFDREGNIFPINIKNALVNVLMEMSNNYNNISKSVNNNNFGNGNGNKNACSKNIFNQENKNKKKND